MMESETSPSETLVLICKKCGEAGRDLFDAVRAEAKSRGRRKEVRAVLTSCLGVCPLDRVALAIVPTGNSVPPRLASIGQASIKKDPRRIAEKLLNTI